MNNKGVKGQVLSRYFCLSTLFFIMINNLFSRLIYSNVNNCCLREVFPKELFWSFRLFVFEHYSYLFSSICDSSDKIITIDLGLSSFQTIFFFNSKKYFLTIVGTVTKPQLFFSIMSIFMTRTTAGFLCAFDW